MDGMKFMFSSRFFICFECFVITVNPQQSPLCLWFIIKGSQKGTPGLHVPQHPSNNEACP